MVGIAEAHKAIRAIAAVAKLCKIFVASSRTTDDLALNGCHDAMGLAVLCRTLAPTPPPRPVTSPLRPAAANPAEIIAVVSVAMPGLVPAS
jgi:hypothetical protein